VRWPLRLGLLLVFGVLAGARTCATLRQSAESYDVEVAALQDAGYRARWLDPASRTAREATLARMNEQNALLFQWAVVLLGGVAALVTTSKVHRIGHVDTVYVLLAPAAVLLLGSIALGIRFQRSLTFLVSRDYSHPPALNPYLFQQGERLFEALACLALFVVVFYLLIVFGGTVPTEEATPPAKENA
jgi:hypothetical protein